MFHVLVFLECGNDCFGHIGVGLKIDREMLEDLKKLSIPPKQNADQDELIQKLKESEIL